LKFSSAYTDLVKLEKGKTELVAWQKNMLVAANGGMKPDYVQIVPAQSASSGPMVVDDFGRVVDMEPPPVGQYPPLAYLKVDWRGDQIVKRGEPSVVFGFTSNLPPIDEVVRIVSPPGKGVVSGDIGVVSLIDGFGPGVGVGQIVAPGTVPTPIPPIV